MNDPLEQKARDLTKKINEQIEKACEGKSHMQWKFIAEQTADMFLSGTPWEHLMHEPMGRVPQVILTEYRATNYREPLKGTEHHG